MALGVLEVAVSIDRLASMADTSHSRGLGSSILLVFEEACFIYAVQLVAFVILIFFVLVWNELLVVLKVRKLFGPVWVLVIRGEFGS